jgi:hypothetical protein
MGFLRGEVLQPNSMKQQQFRKGTDNSLWGYHQHPNAAPSMHLINLIEEELRAYRETGRAIHLVHAARALEEAQKIILRANASCDAFKPARRH